MTAYVVGQPMLQAQALECVRGEFMLFHDLSFRVGAGELLHLAGPNGSGKTTLLRILAGLAVPDVGVVSWRGSPIRAMREAYCAQLVYIGHAAGLKDDLTAIENVRFATRWCAPRSRPDPLAALAQMQLGEVAFRYARQLSQGQRRRVALARLLHAEAAPLWLLDEPFAMLDSDAMQIVEQTIDAHLDRGGLVVLTTHQPLGLLAQRSRRIGLNRNAAC